MDFINDLFAETWKDLRGGLNTAARKTMFAINYANMTDAPFATKRKPAAPAVQPK